VRVVCKIKNTPTVFFSALVYDNYVASGSPAIPATDYACSNCFKAAEVQRIYHPRGEWQVSLASWFCVKYILLT
jgi:hypothetical protein